MKKIDWYIIRKFLSSFFFAIGIIVIIVIVFDFSEKVDDFYENKAPFKSIVFQYYLNFIPYFINLFSSLIVFISVIFFTSKMAGFSEIVAILSSGVSFKRLLRPYVLAAAFIGVFSFMLANFIIPPANKERIAFQNNYFKSGEYKNKNVHIHMQTKPGEYVYVERYNVENNTGHKFSLERVSQQHLMYKLHADVIQWDSIENKWKLTNYYIRFIKGEQEYVFRGSSMDTTLTLSPKDFYQDKRNIETMNFFQLNRFIEQEKIKGSDEVPFFQVEKHKRIAYPFSAIILTLIAVSLSSRKTRGGIGLHLGIGIALSFIYIMFMQITTTFATNGNLHPFMAVWIPNLLFAVVAAWLVYKAPK